jgi:hypothetical protein
MPKPCWAVNVLSDVTSSPHGSVAQRRKFKASREANKSDRFQEFSEVATNERRVIRSEKVGTVEIHASMM